MESLESVISDVPKIHIHLFHSNIFFINEVKHEKAVDET